MLNFPSDQLELLPSVISSWHLIALVGNYGLFFKLVTSFIAFTSILLFESYRINNVTFEMLM